MTRHRRGTITGDLLWTLCFFGAAVMLWVVAIPKIHDHFLSAMLVATSGGVMAGVGLYGLLWGETL